LPSQTLLLKRQWCQTIPITLDSYPDNTTNRDPNWNPTYDYQWDMKKIKMEQAWDIATGSASIIVAVSDTGVDTHIQNSEVVL